MFLVARIPPCWERRFTITGVTVRAKPTNWSTGWVWELERRISQLERQIPGRAAPASKGGWIEGEGWHWRDHRVFGQQTWAILLRSSGESWDKKRWGLLESVGGSWYVECYYMLSDRALVRTAMEFCILILPVKEETCMFLFLECRMLMNVHQ